MSGALDEHKQGIGMRSPSPTLRERVDEVEARVARRQERLPLRWRQTQRAARTVIHVNRTLPLVATGAAILIGYLLLRRPPQTVKAASALGVLVPVALALIRPRYGALYALAWRLLSQGRAPSATSAREVRR